MARRYAVTGTDTNTASTTQAGITSAATVRPVLYYIEISSPATPAEQAAEYFIQRYTAAGTSTAFTPVALDPGDPASLASAGINHSVEPTYTASAVMLRWAMNQRVTFQWAAPVEFGLKMPATAANGLGLLSNAVTSAFANCFTLHFEE